ncbi:undecaprenyl-diphosphate phosphatase [Arundinibacter roseus]|uniref:Undecaprenyl-diphosphatase n=1 Tax=Arundinibacter roseus TaxID=2070510 RepID=A0A4R4K9J0_9BACT|nr:undecaprenyl-diphosphate phosphatase [Arundinibacter roseus]TDB64474.1 undecaprenyl-diphosphate phosphatase [Arundinibacter roseus]
MTIWQAVILAIIEGITEFLPVSSTGHMIIASSLMGISHLEFTKMFTVNIQFGAILSVLVLYSRRFLQTKDFYFKLFVAFLPAAFFGLLLNDYIDALLENVVVVAISLLVGGIILVFIDKIANDYPKDREVTYTEALKIGFYQCIAMVPGVSRSAATIIGGMFQGLTRKQAAEFSFFLAVPTMAAAAGYKFLKTYESIQASDIKILLLGNVVAFIVAMLAIRFFINFLTRYGFKLFGYYRIALGIILLTLLALGYKIEIV